MNDQKKRFVVVVVIFILSMSLSVILSIDNLRGILNNNHENDRRLVASLVSNAIENSLLRPITVSETISKDANTKRFLGQSTKAAAEEVETEAAEYLESIRSGFGYSMVFAVSDLSKAYYTSNGITKYIDIENDEHDIWYRHFLDSGKKYDLDVDTDVDEKWALSVFINTGVYDDDNRFLGVCGVGVEMSELQDILERYERIYDVKINLIDNTGLIQVDTEKDRIERDYLEIDYLNEVSDGEVYYEVKDDGNRIITYLESMDWYLVVQDEDGLNRDIINTIAPGIMCMVLGVLLMAAVLIYGWILDKKE